MEMPKAVGLVGGATRVHPVAQTAVRMLGIRSVNELAETIVAVGLAQNLAAVRALATEGIQRDHMSLHARSPSPRMRRRPRSRPWPWPWPWPTVSLAISRYAWTTPTGCSTISASAGDPTSGIE